MVRPRWSAGAEFSPCGRYRYRLWRRWDPIARPGQTVLYVMLNPSTADAEHDDPTIRSCMRLARWLGYGGMEVGNLFGWRATDPAELDAVADPVGPDNDQILVEASIRADQVVCAWGAHPAARLRPDIAATLILANGPLWCLGRTRNGSPRHPLYVASGTVLERWWPKEAA